MQRAVAGTPQVRARGLSRAYFTSRRARLSCESQEPQARRQARRSRNAWLEGGREARAQGHQPLQLKLPGDREKVKSTPLPAPLLSLLVFGTSPVSLMYIGYRVSFQVRFLVSHVNAVGWRTNSARTATQFSSQEMLMMARPKTHSQSKSQNQKSKLVSHLETCIRSSRQTHTTQLTGRSDIESRW